jgi:eukaryotic-like serine/threonine-protein kinase
MSAREDWARIKALFGAALDQPEAERDAWLAAQCADDARVLAEVRSLIAAQAGARDDLLSRGARVLVPALAAVPVAEPALAHGARIGPYVVIREIGAGGMGRVFLATREDGQYRRQVALKLIREDLVSPELLKRFLRERDTLARLVHPNIATLLDGGVEGNAPYFTMEFVEGAPIDTWCDTHRLDLRARVALMIRVCDAVQHAHRNLVVHRDIKPSNVLVGTDGEPKLLDFGIAKPLDAEAGTGQLTGSSLHPMTREYAAPEQLLGEPITIATDEYALGVLLYRLLTHRMPYRRAELGATSWAKAIIEESPEPLERALTRPAPITNESAPPPVAPGIAQRRALRGDLEHIVQRALAKSPEARYATVEAFADDLRAYVAGRALSGDTRTFRLRKFCRRHWLPLTAAAVAVVAILLGAVGVAWESQQRRLAAEDALHQAQGSAAVKDFVVALFQNANPNATRGEVRTLRDAVDLGVQRLDRLPAEQPELKAELQLTLAQIYFELDDYAQDFTLANQAFEALRSRAGDDVLAARAERYAATALASLGDVGKAQPLADDAVQRLRHVAAPSDQDLARTLYTASWVALKRGDLDRVKRYADEAELDARRQSGAGELLYKSLEMKGDWARRTHDDALAVASYRQALAASIAFNGPDDEESVTLGHELALSLDSQGRYDDAIAALQRALAISTKLFGEAGGRTLRLGEVGVVIEGEAGHLIAARTRCERLVELIQSHAPINESLLAELRLNCGEIADDLGDYAAARRQLLQSRDFLIGREGSDPGEMAEMYSALAGVEIATGRLAEAEQSLHDAQAILASRKRPAPAIIDSQLGLIRLLQGDLPAALELGHNARDTTIASDGERSYDTAIVHADYGFTLAAAHRDDEAEREWRAALASYAAMLPPDGLHPRSADVRFALGEQLAHRDDQRAEGVRLIEQGIALREQLFGADDKRAQSGRTLLATLGPAHASERKQDSPASR